MYTSFIVHIAYYVQMCSLMQALQKAGNFCKQAVPNEHQTASSTSPHYTLSPPPAQKKIAQKNANCAARKFFEIIELLSRVFRSRLENNEIVDRIKDGRLKNCRKNEIAAARPNYLVEYDGCRFQELSQLRKLSQLSQVCQKTNWTRL